MGQVAGPSSLLLCKPSSINEGQQARRQELAILDHAAVVHASHGSYARPFPHFFRSALQRIKHPRTQKKKAPKPAYLSGSSSGLQMVSITSRGMSEKCSPVGSKLANSLLLWAAPMALAGSFVQLQQELCPQLRWLDSGLDWRLEAYSIGFNPE